MSKIKLQLDIVEEFLGSPAVMIGCWQDYVVYTPRIGDEEYILADGENVRFATNEEIQKITVECR